MRTLGLPRPRQRGFAVFLSIPLLLSALPAAAAPPTTPQHPADLVWSQAEKPVLENSREYVLQGRSVKGTCEYSYPEVNLSASKQAWEVHDLAVGMSSCTKVVLEGRPQDDLASAASAAIERNSRYQQQIWWEDVIGITVTWTQTKISWWWDGTCALGGNTYRYYDMFEQSGWQFSSGNKSSSSSCGQYVGNSWATFRNDLFCSALPGWTDPVYVYVTRNQIIGKKNGTASVSYASTHSPSCAGLFLHRAYGRY